MSSAPTIASCMIFLSACVLSSDHDNTKLVRVCTSEVAVTLRAEGAGLMVGSIAVDGIGASVDHPNARATVGTLTIETTNPAEDFGFAEAMHLDFIALDSPLPRVRALDAPSMKGQSPWTAAGDPTVDLVDYLTSEMLEMRLELTGTAPSAPLEILFSACLDVDGIRIDDK